MIRGESNAHRRARRGWALAGLGLLLAMGATAGFSRLEEADRFCVACHTAPEVEYFNRAQVVVAGGAEQDLASAHYGLIEPEARCIDCHRGDGRAGHRALTFALGARDALVFLAGQANPALEKNTSAAPGLLTAACAKCHAETLLVVGFENHFHNKLPEAYAAWQGGGTLTAPPDLPEANIAGLKRYATTVTCQACHRAHVTVDFGEEVLYLDTVNAVYPACVQCHREVGQGPLELVAP